MELSLEQQIFEQFKKTEKILIILPVNLNADLVASGLALKRFLEKQQKDAVVVSVSDVPVHLKFLPGADGVRNKLENGKSLVLTVNTDTKPLEEISYQKTEHQVHIYLKAKNQEFYPEDVSFGREKIPFDLIVALGGKSLDDFGQVFDQSAERFYEVPKINIDHNPANEYFGAINLVDIAATSVAEILAGLMKKFEQQLVDEDIATCLLSGIIEKTGSFQHVKTTPRAFLHASELVSLGGRQQEIIKNIFKTKSLPQLKLWGRALARMKILEDKSAVYAVLGVSDFEKTQAGETEVVPTLKELIDNISGYKIFALLVEVSKNNFSLLVALHEQLSLPDTAENLLGAPLRPLNFNLGNYKIWECRGSTGSLEEWEQRLLHLLQELD